MKTPYQELFDEVRASRRLKEEVMNVTKQERTQIAKKVSVSFLIAAALAVIVAGTALAAAIGIPQTLQEWFGKQWAESGGGEEMPQEQSAVIESLVQPVGITCSGYGVTITLDSVTPGENCLWMYLKVKGEKLEDPWEFIREELTGTLMDRVEPNELGYVGAGMAIYPMSDTVKGEQDLVIQYNAPAGVSFLEGGRLVLELNDILLRETWPEEGNEEPGYELLTGSWALPFILAPVEEQEALVAESAVVPCMSYGTGGLNTPVKIRDIRVTATGFSFIQEEKKTDATIINADIALQLEGGQEIRSGGGGGSQGTELNRYSWELPADLSKAEAIRFGDVVVPLTKEAE